MEFGFKKPKATFFKQFAENPNIDIRPGGIKFFIKNFAYDANPIWLLTGQGAMLKSDDEKQACKDCEAKDKQITELIEEIGSLKYQLRQLKKKK